MSKETIKPYYINYVIQTLREHGRRNTSWNAHPDNFKVFYYEQGMDAPDFSKGRYQEEHLMIDGDRGNGDIYIAMPENLSFKQTLAWKEAFMRILDAIGIDSHVATLNDPYVKIDARYVVDNIKTFKQITESPGVFLPTMDGDVQISSSHTCRRQKSCLLIELTERLAQRKCDRDEALQRYQQESAHAGGSARMGEPVDLNLVQEAMAINGVGPYSLDKTTTEDGRQIVYI